MDEVYPVLAEDAVERIIAESLAPLPLAGKRVLVIVPDLTRTGVAHRPQHDGITLPS
jgi:hypothetical protein